MTLEILENVPMAPLTTLETGGPARYFLEAADEGSLIQAVAWARELGITTYFLGGGSNVLVADEGLDALVIRLRTRGVVVEPQGDLVLARVAAGEEWDSLVAAMVAADLAGVECLSGIPGSVGAAPIQNIGAYGQEAADTVAEVVALDLSTLERVALSPEACGFGYRDSRFKRSPGEYAVLEVSFNLTPGGEPTLAYPDLAQEIGSSPSSLQHVRDVVLAVRRRKSMVFDPADENHRSVGSFFTNPILPLDQAESVARAAERWVETGGGMPTYPADAGRVKLSAAWLIENAGVRKGLRLGRAGVSTRHTLALVNLGGATTADILRLASVVRRRVLDTFGVELVPEPVCLGFTPPW